MFINFGPTSSYWVLLGPTGTSEFGVRSAECGISESAEQRTGRILEFVEVARKNFGCRRLPWVTESGRKVVGG